MNHLHANFTVTWQDGEVLTHTHTHRAGSISDGGEQDTINPGRREECGSGERADPGWHIKPINHSVSAHFEKAKTSQLRNCGANNELTQPTWSWLRPHCVGRRLFRRSSIDFVSDVSK